MCSSSWGHEQEKAMLGSFYLDPFTTYLDEIEFRVDLFEVDEGYLIEAERKQTPRGNICIEIKDDYCAIALYQSVGIKQRKILFPFRLEELAIHAELEEELIQIYIGRQSSPIQKGPFSLWIPPNEA
jgi:hypothetical protein